MYKYGSVYICTHVYIYIYIYKLKNAGHVVLYPENFKS